MAVDNSKIFNIPGITQDGDQHRQMVLDSMVTKEPSALKDAKDSFTNLQTSTESVTDKINGLSSKILDGGKSVNSSVTDLAGKIDLLKTAIEDLKQASATPLNEQQLAANFNTFVTGIRGIRQDVLDACDITSTIEDYVRTTQASSDIIQVVAELRSFLSEVNNESNKLVSFVDKFEQLSTQAEVTATNVVNATSSLGDAATAAGDFGQRVRNVGDNVNAAAADVGVAADAAKSIQAQADSTSSTVKLLINELDKAAQNVRAVDSLSKKYFENFASEANLGVVNQLASTIDQVQSARANSDNGDYDSASQKLSSATRNVIESLVMMSGELSAKQATANDQFNMLHSVKSFGDDQLRAIQNFATILEARAANGDNSAAAIAAINTRTQLSEITDLIKSSIGTISENLSSAISSDVSINVGLSAMHYNKVPQNMSSSAADLAGVRNAIDFPQTQPSAWYTRFGGNFVTNRGEFGDNIVNAQRTNMASQIELPAIMDNLSKFKEAGDEKGVAAILNRLVLLVTKNAEAHRTAGSKLNLYRGQYNDLNVDDKSVVDNFSKSTKSSVSNLREVIRAVEEVDPSSSSLKNLNSLNKELTGMSESIEASKAKSTAFGDTVKNALAGITKTRNIIGAGLGVMGLGALAPNMRNVTGFGANAFKSYADDGNRRYDLAMTDASMGAAVNPARASYLTNDMADYYYKLSGGRVGFDEVPKAYSNLAANVGGHYGESNESAANDMMTITKDTFGMQKLYGLSDNTVSGTMKTFYKDLRMSADDASGVLASLCQTAQTANLPVGKYADLVVRMADSLRDVGVDGRQTKAIMNSLVSRGLRQEDASDLVNGMSKAQSNMASNWNESAFYGMMAGQGGDPFENIRSGLMFANSNGDIDGDYYDKMAQRVLSRNSLMSSMGGGAGSALGSSMMFDDFVKQGFSKKSASMLTDAAMKGDSSLLSSLMKKADDEKDGGKAALTKAMTEANKQIAASSSQLAETTKVQADLALAQKKLGEKIRDDLTAPLATFRKGFENALKTIVDTLGKFMDKLNKLLSGGLGKSALETAGNHPFLTAGAGVLGGMAAGGALALTKRAITKGAASVINKAASRIFGGGGKTTGAVAENAAKFEALEKSGFVVAGKSGATSTLAQHAEMEAAQKAATSSHYGKLGLGVAAAGALLYGGYKAYEHFSTPSGDPASETNRLFKTGEAKIKITNDPSSLTTPEPGSAAYGGPGGSGVGDDSSGNNPSSAQAPSDVHAAQADGGASWLALGTAGLGSAYDAFKSRGTVNAIRSGEGSTLSKLMGVGKRLGRGTALTAAALGIAGAYEEYQDAQAHPGAEPAWKRAMRVGIDVGAPILGSVVGGAVVGTLTGGAGTVPGAMLGGAAGSYIGDFIKDKAGLAGDKSDTSIDKMKDASSEQVQRYTDSADSLVNSNSERGKAAERELKRHGQTLSDLNQDQQRYMDELFNQLRAAGYGELQASQLAANTVANQVERKYTEGDKVFKNVLDSPSDLNSALYTQQTQAIASGKKNDVKGVNNAIHWQEGGSDMNPSDHGNDDRDTIVNNDITTLKDLVAKYGVNSSQVRDWTMSNYRTSDGGTISEGSFDKFKGQLNKMSLTGNSDDVYETLNSYENDNYTFWAQQAAMQQAQDAAANSNNEKPTIQSAANANAATTPRGGHSLFDNMAEHQITSGFGNREYNGVNEFHPGVDYAANLNDKVYSPTDGKVSFTGTDDSGGYGNMVTITHDDGSKVILAHNNSFNTDLKDGQMIKAGTVVSYAGSTGKSDGVHVHAEVRDANGNAVDPSEYMAKGMTADGSLGDGTSTSTAPVSGPSTRATTPADAYKNSQNLINNYSKQIADLHGLSTSDIMSDRIATGQVVFGGASTAFMDRGVYMNARGVRDDLYKMSGIRDFDRNGYGVRGYFGGDGKASNLGSVQIRANADKAYGADKSTLNFVEGAERGLSESTDKMFSTVSDNRRENEENYRQVKLAEEERQARDGGADAKNRTNCQVTVIETGGGGEVKRSEFVAEINRVNEGLSHVNSYLNNIGTYHM